MSVYRVGVVVKGAKSSNGARGNVFKFLERHHGLYSEREGINIKYSDCNLHVSAYFREARDAMDFQSALNQWEIHKQLANLEGVELTPPDPVLMHDPLDLKRVYLQHYIPGDSESPCQSLDQLHSYHLSVPITEAVEPDDDLSKYQSFEKSSLDLKFYKCHLMNKTRCSSALQRDENNMLACSWEFRQRLDGMNTKEGIPTVKIKFVAASDLPLAERQHRFRVTLDLTFRSQLLMEDYSARLQGGASRPSDAVWRVVVYVKDKETFKRCVDWKERDTQAVWDRFDHCEDSD